MTPVETCAATCAAQLRSGLESWISQYTRKDLASDAITHLARALAEAETKTSHCEFGMLSTYSRSQFAPALWDRLTLYGKVYRRLMAELDALGYEALLTYCEQLAGERAAA